MRRDDVEHALDALASEVPAPTADAVSLIARGRRRIFRQRILIIGIAAAVIAMAAGVGAVASNDDARRVVAPVPTTTKTPTTTWVGGPAQQIAVVSTLEAWKCLDPLQYTNDGGRSWRAIDIPSSNKQPASGEAMQCAAVAGANATAMWPTSDFRERYVARIRDFTDLRISRFPLISGDEYLSAPIFVDADHGWVQSQVGDSAFALYRTVDGGVTWTVATRNHRLGGLVFTSVNEGWSLYDGELATTSDGGTSWRTVALPSIPLPSGQQLGRFGVSVFGDSIVVWSGLSDVASENGPHDTFFDVSTDRGKTWTRRDGPSGFERPSYNTFNATDASHWQLASGQALRITDDGGQTWRPRPDIPGDDSILRMAFPTPDVGWITTARGAVLRTTDSGRTWTDVTNGAAPDTTATTPSPDAVGFAVPAPLAFASATEGWICDDPFEYSTDAFATVAAHVEIPTAAYPAEGQQPLCAAAPGGNAWFVRASGAPGNPEIVRIRSGGADVQVFPLPSTPAIESISFVDADNGWALGGYDDQHDLYRTRDGGATWSLVLRDAPIRGSLAFDTPDRGWAAAAAGARLVTTTDGGRTWREVAVPSPAPHRGLPLSIRGVRVRGGVIVAFGGQTTGNFLTPFFDVSTDGGDSWKRSPGPRALLKSLANNFDVVDADHWSIGWSNYLYITDDAGKTWNESAFAGVYRIEDIAFLDANVAFVSGLGDALNRSAVVLKTTDGGDHWTTVDAQSPIGPPGEVASVPGGIIGCPTRPLTPAPPGDPPPGLVAAAIQNIRTERHYNPTVDSVYRVDASAAGTFASVFTFNVGSCGAGVVENTWVVELSGPIGQGGGGSTAQAQVVLAHYADGWHVFGRYH